MDRGPVEGGLHQGGEDRAADFTRPRATRTERSLCFFPLQVKRRATKAQPRIRQAKILRETDRADRDGNPKSKGLGFIEFEDHEHALCALRELNNNPVAFKPDRRPIIEFAIENVKVLKLRDVKLSQQKKQGADRKRKRAGDGEDGEETDRPAKKSRSARRKERKQREKEAAERGEAPPAEAAPASQKKGKPADEGRAATKLARDRRRERAEQHQQAELQLAAQRRRSEEELDRLVSLEADRKNSKKAKPGKGEDKSKDKPRTRGKGEAAKEANLDQLVAEYTSKLFGAKAKEEAAARAAAPKSRDSIKRWFE